MVEILITDNDGNQKVSGHFFLQGGKVVSTDERNDHILESPCRVGNKEVTATASPKEWLNALPANYSGTRLRARKV